MKTCKSREQTLAETDLPWLWSPSSPPFPSPLSSPPLPSPFLLPDNQNTIRHGLQCGGGGKKIRNSSTENPRNFIRNLRFTIRYMWMYIIKRCFRNVQSHFPVSDTKNAWNKRYFFTSLYSLWFIINTFVDTLVEAHTHVSSVCHSYMDCSA